MRKLIASTFVSIDGVTDNPQTWASRYFNPAAQAASLADIQQSGGMLMGRRTYEYLAAGLARQAGAYPDALNRIRKYVFSATLAQTDWNNSTIIHGDPVAEVGALKQRPGGDLVMYGHGRLSRTLLAAGLIDEVRFAIHPLLLGGAAAWGPAQEMELLSATPLTTGVIAAAYRPDR